jgi:hypothetical protein
MQRSCIQFAAMVCTTALCAFPNAHGAERGFYAGAGYSDVSADYGPRPILLATSDLYDSGMETIGPRGFKAAVGYRALDWLAIEADYLDLSQVRERIVYPCVGGPCVDHSEADTSSGSFSALALWPIGRFDLFVRAGFMSWKSQFATITSAGTVEGSADFSGTNGKYGAGAQFNLRWITARLEYEELRFGALRADSWSLGFAYRFR